MSSDKSMADKVKELCFGVEKFKKELFELNDKMVNTCTITMDFSAENLEKKVYPELRKMKERYGIDIPIGLCGVDMPRLDKRLDMRLEEFENFDKWADEDAMKGRALVDLFYRAWKEKRG